MTKEVAKILLLLETRRDPERIEIIFVFAVFLTVVYRAKSSKADFGCDAVLLFVNG